MLEYWALAILAFSLFVLYFWATTIPVSILRSHSILNIIFGDWPPVIARSWSKICQQFHVKSILAGYEDLSPQKLQNIETTMLPMLMCTLAKNGNTDSIKQLLEYGASPNSRSEYSFPMICSLAKREYKICIGLNQSWYSDKWGDQ